MNHSLSSSQQNMKSRWRNSLNQFSKLQEQSQMSTLDHNLKKTNFLKLKMKNRLGQVDPQFFPQEKKIQKLKKQEQKSSNNKLASTNHGSNLYSLNEPFDKNKFPVIFESQQNYNHNNPEQVQNNRNTEQTGDIIQKLTEYNQQKYNNDMQNSLNKSKNKSFIQSLFKKDQPQITAYCFHCDEKLLQNHKCSRLLDSLPRVDRALLKLKNQIQVQNKRIFSIFLHNLTLEQHELDQLINHVKVLKTAHQLEYDPKQAVYRMRLMNLIGKKIGIIIHITSQQHQQ